MGIHLLKQAKAAARKDEVHPDGGFRVRCSPVPVAGGLHAG